MIGARYLPQQSYLALKSATRDLVAAVGGTTRAAGISRLGQSEYSRGGGVGERDIERFLPVDVIADLEAQSGAPVITKVLADLADCLLIPLPRGTGIGGLSQDIGLSAQAFGKLMSDIGAAVADGSIDHRERHALRADIRQLMTALATLDETVRARREDDDG